MSLTDHALDQHIGRRLAQRREALELSQRDAIKRLGFSQAQLAKYELGRHPVSAATLYHIAQAYGVPMSYFFATYPKTAALTEQDRFFRLEGADDFVSSVLKLDAIVRARLFAFSKDKSS